MSRFDDAYAELLALQADRYGIGGDTELAEALARSNLGTSKLVDGDSDGKRFPLARLSVPQRCARPWDVSWSASQAGGLTFTPDSDIRSTLWPIELQTSRSYVEVSWGQGGVQRMLRADVGRGQSCVVSGSWVNVDLLVDFRTESATQETIGASVAPHCGLASPSPLLCSVPVAATMANETIRVGIPPRATRAILTTDADSFGQKPQARVIGFETPTGVDMGGWQFDQFEQSVDWLPIPPQCSVAYVTAFTANITQVVVVFEVMA